MSKSKGNTIVYSATSDVGGFVRCTKRIPVLSSFPIVRPPNMSSRVIFHEKREVETSGIHAAPVTC
eukprot:scaffold161972_cov118-Attheya_sp.AAC.1